MICCRSYTPDGRDFINDSRLWFAALARHAKREGRGKPCSPLHLSRGSITEAKK
jgi:hypothetical protein